MPGSVSLRAEVIDYLGGRFGVTEAALEPFLLQERHGEVWAATCVVPTGITLSRPAGLRALRRQGSGLKPTSAFLILLGDAIRSNRAEVGSAGQLTSLLLGKDLPSSLSAGFVAVAFRGDVLGCGAVREGRLHALLPTGRKRELLEALEAERAR